MRWTKMQPMHHCGNPGMIWQEARQIQQRLTAAEDHVLEGVLFGACTGEACNVSCCIASVQRPDVGVSSALGQSAQVPCRTSGQHLQAGAACTTQSPSQRTIPGRSVVQNACLGCSIVTRPAEASTWVEQTAWTHLNVPVSEVMLPLGEKKLHMQTSCQGALMSRLTAFCLTQPQGTAEWLEGWLSLVVVLNA